MTTTPLLKIEDLTVRYSVRRGRSIDAVAGVMFEIGNCETLGLVGESGSGKSTIGRAVLGLVPVASGRISFAGVDITHANRAARRQLSRDIQIVFQDPYGSLNPARTVGQTLAEPLMVHERLDRRAAAVRVAAMLERVGLDASAAQRYPGQFSGGQRQRIGIARAVMLSPRLVVCDEPVSSLDLSIQAQILNLLGRLQEELNVSYLFIAHDLSVVRHVSRRIAVLYQGRIMEIGASAAVHATPAHPYTRALLAAAPVADPGAQRARRELRPRVLTKAAPTNKLTGCPFMPRCPYAIAQCERQPPLELAPNGALAACIRAAELPAWNHEKLGEHT